MHRFLLTSAASVVLVTASDAYAASDTEKPVKLPDAILEAGPIAGPPPQRREVMQPISRPSVGAEPFHPIRFARADAQFHELLGKRLPLPVAGPFADLLRGVKPIPAPSPIPAVRAAPSEPATVQTARAH